MLCNLLAIFLLSGSLFNLGSADNWSYPTPKANGVLSSGEHWGGECDKGRRQSPVDLAFDASVKGTYPTFSFRNYELPIADAKVTNTGHSVQINNVLPTEVAVSGGGLPGIYLFDQMHFHWSSEHTINERWYGVELHLVHHEQRFKSLSEAAGTKNGIAVVGVLFHVSDEHDDMLELILRSVESSQLSAGESASLLGVLAPGSLLPKNQTSYFRYEGSLTTPGCGEAVVWTVFTESLPISMEQIERFKALKATGGHKLTHNNRSLQPLNARPLVYVADEKDHYRSSANSMKSYALTTLLTVLGIFGLQSAYVL